MKINQLIKSSLLKKQFENTLGYFADDQTIPMYKNCSNFKPWIFIVARKHYTIVRNSYPALSQTELKAMLKITYQQYDTIKPLIEIKANKEIDGFDVKTIIFHDDVAQQLSQAWLLIPETEILAQQKNDQQLYELHTPAGLMFFSQSEVTNHSVYRGGIIQNAITYKHSIGMAEDLPIQKIDDHNYLCFLAEQFNSLSITNLPNITCINHKNKVTALQFHALYWGPLLGITMYLALASGWQWFSIGQTEKAIASQSENANQLLSQKQQLDTLNSKVSLFNQHIAQSPLVLSDWEIVNSALNTGMVIDRFSSRQGELLLSGEAKNANSVIGEVSKLSQVKSAIFKGGVRKYRGSEVFEIKVTLRASSMGGVKP